MTTVYPSCLHQVLSELSARNTCMACFPMLTTSNKVTASTTWPFRSWLTLLLPVEFLLMFSHCSRTFRFSLWNESSKQSMWENTTHNRHSQTQAYFALTLIIPSGCSVMPQGPQQILTKHNHTNREWKKGSNSLNFFCQQWVISIGRYNRKEASVQLHTTQKAVFSDSCHFWRLQSKHRSSSTSFHSQVKLATCKLTSAAHKAQQRKSTGWNELTVQKPALRLCCQWNLRVKLYPVTSF